MNALSIVAGMFILIVSGLFVYGTEYSLNSSGFLLGPAYNYTRQGSNPFVITFGSLAHANITKPTMRTLVPKYPVPLWGKQYFDGTKSTCDGLYVPKVPANLSAGYACLNTKGLPATGFNNYTITAHYIIQVNQ